jgi:hypothetical protein
VSNYQQALFTCVKSISQIVDIFIATTAHIAVHWRTFCSIRVAATQAAPHTPKRVSPKHHQNNATTGNKPAKPEMKNKPNIPSSLSLPAFSAGDSTTSGL